MSNTYIIITDNTSSDEKTDENVCLYKYTGVFHSYTYFNLIQSDLSNDQKKEEKTLIVIRSAWLITYQNKLANSLLSYKYIDNTSSDRIELLSEDEEKQVKLNNCDWLTKAHFREYGVQKGSVFSNINNNNTEYIKKAVSIATKSLDDNYPDVEISILVIVPIISFFIALFIFGYIEDRKNRNGELNNETTRDNYNRIDV